MVIGGGQLPGDAFNRNPKPKRCGAQIRTLYRTLVRTPGGSRGGAATALPPRPTQHFSAAPCGSQGRNAPDPFRGGRPLGAALGLQVGGRGRLLCPILPVLLSTALALVLGDA